MKKQIHNATLEILQGDITALAVDAIVNAANIQLQHGGGVAAAIARRRPDHPTRIRRSHCEAWPTVGDRRSCAYRWWQVTGEVRDSRDRSDLGEGDEDNKLRRAIRNSLILADEKKLKSIAFPAISTGIYGFPVERGAKLMLQEAAVYLRGDTGLERVIFCLFGEPSYRVFTQNVAD